jgi:hypothetical protein
MDPSHVRRDFRPAIRNAPGIDPADWTPRELRHSFVSLLSDSGTPIEEIARLVGHRMHGSYRVGLPSSDQAGSPDRRSGHGPHLPLAARCLVPHLVFRQAQRSGRTSAPDR